MTDRQKEGVDDLEEKDGWEERGAIEMKRKSGVKTIR